MKTAIIISLFLITLLILSCNDSINPNAEFKEDFILNGIIRGDSTYQVITLTHSYQTDGPDPLSYKDNPAITGKRVEIYYNNTVYLLRDSSISREDTSHFHSAFNFYYTNNLKPDINKEIEIIAFLPNGQILESRTITPNVPLGFFNYIAEFPQDSENNLLIQWDNNGRYGYEIRLYIYFYIKGDIEIHKIDVPLFALPDGNPVYKNIIRNNYLYIDNGIVSKTLKELINLYPNKSDITIVNMTVDLIVLDEYLSAYYSVIKLGIDDFTVRTDNPDLTNIRGGLGIFGTYARAKQKIRFNGQYLRSLGLH
jgi:hypothetical protein